MAKRKAKPVVSKNEVLLFSETAGFEGNCGILIVSPLSIGTKCDCRDEEHVYTKDGERIEDSEYDLVSDQIGDTNGALMASTIVSQKKEAVLLAKLGFKAIGSFKNKKTGNTSTIWLYTK